VKGDFERYLAAKETVDDRALDRRVLGRVRADVADRSGARVLDAGAGTGAFARRFLAWDDRPDCTYVAVDDDPALLSTARERILDHARALGFAASVVDPTAGPAPDAATEGAPTVAALRLRGPARIDVRLVAGDARTVAAAGEWDVLVAQAFVDLLSLDGVARLLSGVADGGLVYLPITFDGGTAFTPSHPADDAVLDAYHATMAGPEGDRLGATAGRRLLDRAADLGVDLDAVGGSDWVVAPPGGEYPADESYFLDVVVDTVGDAVRGRVADGTIEAWLDARRRQREEGVLGFLARNLDLSGRRVRSR
jgi:SAM-dependent methyltransferase